MSSTSNPTKIFFEPGFVEKHFDKISAVLDSVTGNPTQTIAEHIATIPPTPDSNSVILDNACGTGFVAFEVLKQSTSKPHPKVYATDISSGMVDQVQAKAKKAQLDIEASVMDCQHLTFQDNMFTHSYMNFGMFMVPDPCLASEHIYRTLKPGGKAVITTWKRIDHIPVIQAARKLIRPEEDWDMPMSKDWKTEEKLRGSLVGGGFDAGKISITVKSTGIVGESPDELVNKLKIMMPGVMTGWSESESERFNGALLECLSEEQRKTSIIETDAWIAVAEK